MNTTLFQICKSSEVYGDIDDFKGFTIHFLWQNNLAMIALDEPSYLSKFHVRRFKRDAQVKTVWFGFVHQEQEEAQGLQKRRQSSDLWTRFCPLL